jgi:hypothetical protein
VTLRNYVRAIATRRWESWVVYTRDGERVGERRLRRHLTEGAARRWGEAVAYRPEVLAATIETALGGRMVFVEAEVRRRPDAPDRSGRLRIAPDASGTTEGRPG